ncbi:MAG: PAS domain-containing protein, partial [Planctomycetota bacterium]
MTDRETRTRRLLPWFAVCSLLAAAILSPTPPACLAVATLGLAVSAVSQSMAIRAGRAAENQANQALRTLHQIAAQVPGVVYQYQLWPDGRSCFPYASEGIREIYRVSPEEVRDDASPVLAKLHPDDVDVVLASIDASAQQLSTWQHQYRVVEDDGTVRWLYGNAEPERMEDGSTLWHGFICDITQKRQKEAEAERAAAHLRAVVDAATDFAIVAADPNGNVQLFNA